jgi:hypothetical protein
MICFDLVNFAINNELMARVIIDDCIGIQRTILKPSKQLYQSGQTMEKNVEKTDISSSFISNPWINTLFDNQPNTN